jgi:hypothetical protein
MHSQKCIEQLLALPSLHVSVCPTFSNSLSIHPFTWNNSFHENRYMSISQKSAEKITISLQYDKHNGYFTGRPMYIYENISLNSS